MMDASSSPSSATHEEQEGQSGGGSTRPASGVALDTQGLRTDRLVQACLVPSSISSAPGSNSNPLEVRLTKSRFSTQREHFIGRTAAVPVPCGDWGLEGNAAVSVVALEEALDDATGRISLHLLLREEGATSGGSPSAHSWRLRLCRIEDEIEEGKGNGGRYRLKLHAVIGPPPGDSEGLDAFRLLPGPCLLAWRRFHAPPPRSCAPASPPPPSRPRRPTGGQENQDPNSPTGEATRLPGVWCWYDGAWTRQPLNIQQGPWGADAIAVRVECAGLWPRPDGEEGVAALLNVELKDRSHAWRAMRAPPIARPSSSFCDDTAFGSTYTAAAPAAPAPALPPPLASLPAEILAGCACLCPSAADGRVLYTVSERTGHPTAWCTPDDNADEPLFASVVPKDGAVPAASPLRPPTTVLAFLPRPPPEGDAGEEEDEEWVAVHHADDAEGRLCLFRRVGALILPVREIRGVGGVLRGDCLGLGWDQLALLPAAELLLEAKGALLSVGVTDGRRLWAHGRCVELVEDDEGSPALLQKRWVKDAAREQQQQRRRRQVEEAEKSGSKASGTTGARCQGQGEEEGKEGPAQHEKDRVEAEEDEHRARLVSGVRAALQQRLAAEAQEKARAAAAASMVGRLLRESERVLAALAYREVLPLSLAAPSSSGHGFARGLVLLVPARRTAAAAAAEEEDGGGGGSGPAHDDEPVAAPLPRPVFPIARFALRRRKGRGGAVVGLEARMQAADGLRLRHVALSLFSPYGGPLPFASTTWEMLAPGEEATLVARVQLPSTLLDSATWGADAVVCCSWQAAESLDGDDEDEEGDGNGGGGCCWPSGAQPLGRVTFTADDLLPSSPEEGGGGEDEHDEVEEGLWCVEATSPEEVVGGDDLPSLCAALHRRLTRGEAAVQPGPATRRALRRGLARLVGGLKEELDLLCALVEGTAADPALVRRVWLAQPAQAAAVYLLRLLVAGAEGEEGGRLMYDTLL